LSHFRVEWAEHKLSQINQINAYRRQNAEQIQVDILSSFDHKIAVPWHRLNDRRQILEEVD
jgi:hypothetical protein